MFFYNKRFRKGLFSNPWVRNLVKIIFSEVYVNIDVVKSLIKSYNPITKSFHWHDKIILCTLDHSSFIKAFGLEGQMSVPIDIDEF